MARMRVEASARGAAQGAPLMARLKLDLETVERGVPTERMGEFVSASGMRLVDLYEVVIPARTLKHRRARKETLNRDESDKLARMVRVTDLAVRVFGDMPGALGWMRKPKQRFGGRSPIEMLRTEMGGRMVEEMLGQIDEGMFA